MKTNLSFSAPSQVESECLVVVVLDRDEKDNLAITLESSDAAVCDAAKDVIVSGEVTGKYFETILLHRPAGLKAKRLLLVGGGNAKNFSAADLRKLTGTAVRTLKGKNLRSFALALPENGITLGDGLRALVEGAFVGNFEPDYYKSDRKDQTIDDPTIITSGDRKAAEEAVRVARIVGESQNFTRDLVNEPSNRMTPTMLAERAKKMCSEVGLKCETYGTRRIKELKMGAFWGVAQGADEPPTLIVIRYEPESDVNDIHLGLVGKGITFDSGGISIKPSGGMEKMKYDMAGGATMIGVMRAIALLKPKMRVTAIVCAAENMPSGKAQKPGDVQIAMSGKSIEIIDTDAEGRLVLADGLCYARQIGCTHLVDAPRSPELSWSRLAMSMPEFLLAMRQLTCASQKL